MKIIFDPRKRAATLEKRRVDFRDAEIVFAGPTYTIPDERLPYPEERFLTVGRLSGRMVIVIWTPVADARRIISMRKANDREQARYSHRLG
ncbi:MAG TPA: BrnT family toxin [Stellaceae bacterium]|nr:BrnT family toxin [Stellaceae bacterium]